MDPIATEVPQRLDELSETYNELREAYVNKDYNTCKKQIAQLQGLVLAAQIEKYMRLDIAQQIPNVLENSPQVQEEDQQKLADLE